MWLGLRRAAVMVVLLVAGAAFAQEPIVTFGKPPIRDVQYTPDGRYLSILTATDLRFLDADDYTPIARIPLDGRRELAFSPDGSVFAVSLRETIDVWDTRTRRRLRTLSKGSDPVFSSDGSLLAYSVFLGSKTTVSIVDWRAESVVGEFTVDASSRNTLGGFRFHPMRAWLVVGTETPSRIHIWDFDRGVEHAVLDGVTTPSALRFSHGGRWLAVANYNAATIDLWDLSAPTPTHRRLTESGRSASEAIAFTADDTRLLAGFRDGLLNVFDLRDFSLQTVAIARSQMTPEFNYHNTLRSLSIHPDGSRVAGLVFGYFGVWDLDTFERIHTSYGWGTGMLPAYLPGAETIVTGSGSVLEFRDARDGSLRAAVESGSNISHLATSPDGRTFAFDGNRAIQVWDAATMEQKHAHYVGSGISQIAFSPSGRYLAAIAWGTQIIDVATGEEIQRISGPLWRDYIPLRFTPDESAIVAAGEDEWHPSMWDIATGELVKEFLVSGPLTWGGGRLLQVRPTETVFAVHDVETGRRLATFPHDHSNRPEKALERLGLHASGRLASVMHIEDRQVREYAIFELATGQPLGTLPGLSAPRFTLDGEFVVYQTDDGTFGLFRSDDVLGQTAPPTSVEATGMSLAAWGDVKRNELLQNYPNPFNPETWIPFSIANDARVTITVTDTAGKRVRTLELGRREAGAYLAPGDAAHWDGRNDAGEPVASGVYVARLSGAQDGRFSQTRRIILAK